MNFSVPFQFFIICACLSKHRKCYLHLKGRELSTLAVSLTQTLAASQGWARPKAGAKNLIRVSHMGERNPHNLSHCLLSLRVCVSRKLELEAEMGPALGHSSAGCIIHMPTFNSYTKCPPSILLKNQTKLSKVPLNTFWCPSEWYVLCK